MNRVLSLLVAYVFIQTQAWALSGGPFGQGQSGSANIIGTYAGVLVPSGESIGSNTQGEPLATAIGLFAFSQPDVGFASGPMLAFVEGTPIVGTINGIIDPADGRFRAVISGESTYVVAFDLNGDGTIDLSTPIEATGSIDAQISAISTSTGFTSGLNSARVSGIAGIDIFLFIRNDGTPRVSDTINFEVEGFKQSDTATAVTLTFTSTAGGDDTGGG